MLKTDKQQDLKIIIHDIAPQSPDYPLFKSESDAVTIICPGSGCAPKSQTTPPVIRHCIGCFGCWLKTPGECVIHDGYENMGALFAAAKELCIISECVYGGFSPFVKNVLDRTIGYISPFFRIVQGEMHHKLRYPNSLQFSALFYGADIGKEEKELAQKMVTANALNMNFTVRSVRFAPNAKETAALLTEETA